MKKRNRFKLSVSVGILLIKGKKVLLMKRDETGWMDGYYGLPAGAHDGNASFMDTAIREAKEEVNISIKKADMQLIHALYVRIRGEEWEILLFAAKKWKGTLRINEPDIHSNLKWVSMDKLPTNVVPCIKQAIQMCQNKVMYSEFID